MEILQTEATVHITEPAVMMTSIAITDPQLLKVVGGPYASPMGFERFEAYQEHMKQPARWYDRHRR